MWTDLCDDPYAAGDDRSLGLGPAHATKPGGDQDTAPQVPRAQVPPAGVQQRQLCSDKHQHQHRGGGRGTW